VEAEALAKNGEDINTILRHLRRLSLSDFGHFFISLPQAEYPALSAALPRMAPASVQDSWTGQNGFELYKTTLPFTLQLDYIATRFGGGEGLRQKKVMDFGCGYGRFIRMMYYFTDPTNIWAVDPWSTSLEKCYEAGVVANFVQSEDNPSSLPVGDTKFDFGFSFSVFTHLAPETAVACLRAIRSSFKPGGIFVPTIRPIEFWDYYAVGRPHIDPEKLKRDHYEAGVAYAPSNGERGKTFGDTSMDQSWYNREGWELLGYDSNIYEPYQISLILKAI
jgi:SAM-dependent methyltransferase